MRATTHAADPHATLRRALLLDAVATAGMGALLLVAPALLHELLGLPAALMRGAGAALLPFAALLAWVARRHLVPTTAARALIAANVLWAIDSLILPATGWIDATALGVVFVVGQGLVVAAFAGLEYAGLRRVTHAA
jgi:hypothetical protein